MRTKVIGWKGFHKSWKKALKEKNKRKLKYLLWNIYNLVGVDFTIYEKTKLQGEVGKFYYENEWRLSFKSSWDFDSKNKIKSRKSKHNNMKKIFLKLKKK